MIDVLSVLFSTTIIPNYLAYWRNAIFLRGHAKHVTTKFSRLSKIHHTLQHDPETWIFLSVFFTLSSSSTLTPFNRRAVSGLGSGKICPRRNRAFVSRPKVSVRALFQICSVQSTRMPDLTTLLLKIDDVECGW